MKPEDVPADLVVEFQRAELMAVLDVDGGTDPVRAVLARFLPPHEKQVREQVAAERAVLTPEDLAELLNYIVGREGVRVVGEATLDRAFTALKATQRGES